jgi:hypothetical protein
MVARWMRIFSVAMREKKAGSWIREGAAGDQKRLLC